MMRAKKRVTIKDVAAEAGVSYQTVSRVINNSRRVTDETRLKVMGVIEELNFRPSFAARNLSSQRTNIIGLIVPYSADYLIRDPHLLAQISGIDAEANANDYNLLLSTAGNSEDGIKAYNRFLTQKVADGAIVVETANSTTGNDMLAKQDDPYVVIGYDIFNSNGYMAHSDDHQGAKEATLHLIEQGHQRIGVINGPATGAIRTSHGRLSGYKVALEMAGIPFEPELVVGGNYTRLSGKRATEQLLALDTPLTAIFALNDRMAIGAIQIIQKHGLTVPQDIAVVGFDDIPAAVDFTPSLTTVRQPSRALGKTAARLLFKLIAGKSVENHEVVLPTELIIRQSS
ncbi:LacI family DNA-binding transcriptional regulator [Anaerolineales bacterium HSG24]|nr:LacI family DNA-binding transcriptional regulator [Anaerolineales bacterium HSG24]